MPDVIELLSELIQIPSVNPPGNEHLIVPYLEQFLKRIGAEVTLQEVYPKRSNVVAQWSWGRGRHLVFNTHMDVHNPEGQQWSTDPFVATVSNNRLYGRGTADAKGSLAAMLVAMERLVMNPNDLSGTLTFTIVMGEESGGHGTAHLVASGCEADGAIVGEPTELRIMAANKGTFIRKIAFSGIPSHSGQSHLGLNAIEPATKLLSQIFSHNRRLAQTPHRLVGAPSLVPTVIQGGSAQNTVPGSCFILVDRRLVPGEDHEMARNELIKLIEEAGVSDRVASIEELVKTFPCETDAESDIVLAAQTALGKHGAQTEVTGFPAGCDMSKLVLNAKIPSIILGPGSLAQAHSPNEYVELEQVRRASIIYEDIARTFLKGEHST